MPPEASGMRSFHPWELYKAPQLPHQSRVREGQVGSWDSHPWQAGMRCWWRPHWHLHFHSLSAVMSSPSGPLWGGVPGPLWGGVPGGQGRVRTILSVETICEQAPPPHSVGMRNSPSQGSLPARRGTWISSLPPGSNEVPWPFLKRQRQILKRKLTIPWYMKWPSDRVN